jgi:hypothetical protein
MNKVTGMLDIVKVGGKQEGALMKKDTVGFGSVEELRAIQGTLHVINEMIHEDCYIAVCEPRISIEKSSGIYNWRWEASADELYRARDMGLNNYVLYKTAAQLEKMMDPTGDMDDSEKICLLHCLILDMTRKRDMDIADPYGKRISFAQKLAQELNKPEFLMTLSELEHLVRAGQSGMFSIFDRPAEEGGLRGLEKLHGMSMNFYDKSMAFKLEASTRMKAGHVVFTDINKQYADNGDWEMKL